MSAAFPTLGDPMIAPMLTVLRMAATKSLLMIRCVLIPTVLSLCLIASSYLGWAAPAIAQPLTPQPPTAQAAEAERPSASPSGNQLFTENCAACHAGGGNIIRRGKTLKQKALKRYGYEEADAIISLITLGKGAMPAFGERLSVEEIGAIAQYVQTQAASDWK